jgi:hypothetical protein
MEFRFNVFNLAIYRSENFINLIFRVFISTPIRTVAKNLEPLKHDVGPLLRQPLKPIPFA